MRTTLTFLVCIVAVMGQAQTTGTDVKPSTDLGGTTFKNLEDASVFLKGLIGADTDAYGNVEVNKDGSWGQRMSFRLSDVTISAKEHTTSMEYYGGEVGPRIEISAKCSLGPCVKDPMMPETPAMEEKSFFVTNIPKGKQVFSTLLIMQAFLRK